MGQKLSEIIAGVGDDHVLVQAVHECCSGASTNKRGETKLTINTKAYSTTDFAFPDKAQYIGLIVWIPQAKYRKLKNGDSIRK